MRGRKGIKNHKEQTTNCDWHVMDLLLFYGPQAMFNLFEMKVYILEIRDKKRRQEHLYNLLHV